VKQNINLIKNIFDKKRPDAKDADESLCYFAFAFHAIINPPLATPWVSEI